MQGLAFIVLLVKQKNLFYNLFFLIVALSSLVFMACDYIT